LGVILLASCASSERCERTPAEPMSPPEVRATWVVGNKLADVESARKVCEEAEALRLNTLIVQVRARGDAIYASGIEPKAMHLEGRNVDLLAEILRRAGDDHAVHAWFNACLVANADALPQDSRHVTVAHPEWMSVPEELAQDLWHRPPKDPSYREALAR